MKNAGCVLSRTAAHAERKLSHEARRILRKVERAMQDAEEGEHLDVDDYLNLMSRIAQEAMSRANTCTSIYGRGKRQ